MKFKIVIFCVIAGFLLQASAIYADESLNMPSQSAFLPLSASGADKAGQAANAYKAGNIDSARKIWEELANQGDAEAMNNLGVIYDQGKGVESDAGRATHWFAQSANAGNPTGMSNYARMLVQGRGIPVNTAEAARWFDKAARLGQPEAQYNLGYLYENGHGVPKDSKAAAAWYSRAASSGQKDALARLGHFFRIGKGVEKDRKRAILLLYAAAMDGSENAMAELESLAKEDSPKVNAVLFGQNLSETKRMEMRNALQKAKVSKKREDDSHICDIYDPGKLIPGSTEMAICYGPDNKLGFVKIDYPAQNRQRADAIFKMVQNRFGTPSASEGSDSNLWNLGSVIVAAKYEPDHKQASLMYMVPKVYHLTKSP